MLPNSTENIISGNVQVSEELEPRAPYSRWSNRTREERFREIRDGVMGMSGRMVLTRPGRPCGLVMQCGPFKIVFYPPGTFASCWASNLNIWPGARIECGRLVTENKVANVDWDEFDNIKIWTFRSGPWEAELLRLLRHEGNVLPFR